MLELQCTESRVWASKNIMRCFNATKQMKRMQGQGCWKASFSGEKVAKCNLRVTLKYMKDVSFSWNEMLFAMQKTDFHGLELFLRAKNIMLLELRTLMLCLVQLSKWRECKAQDAEKLLSQWEKGAKFNFKIKAQVHERCFFFMKWNVICNAEDRFSCVRAFLQSKSC